MESQTDLDIIIRTRGEVLSRKEPTGENMFLAWGYPTVLYLLLEFAGLRIWHQDWASWLWIVIPIIGFPLMLYFLHKDYERTRRRSHEEIVVIKAWIFIGCFCALSGVAMGITGVFQQCYFCLFGFSCGLGCFLTGIVGKFRVHTVCGIIASALSVAPLFFQGELWPWQLPVTAGVVIVALIVPGHLFRQYVSKNSVKKI